MREITSFSKLDIKKHQVIKTKDYFIFLNNNEILTDTMSGLWCSPLGYSCDSLKKSMYDQSLINPYQSNFLNHHNQITELYSDKLCNITNMDKVYFTNSGSSAVETAIKISCHISNNKKCAVSKYSYHGSTVLSAAASDQKINLWANIVSPLEVNKFSNFQDLEQLEKNNLSFILIEPVIAAGGVYCHQSEIFKILKYYQNKGTIIIFDETVTGFGKLGTMFAKDLYNFEPDIMILGKAISNGYFPLGACLVKNHIAEKIKFFNHGFTFSGHPIGSAVGLEMINQLKKSNLNHDRFNKPIKSNKIIKHRIVGCMGSIEFSSKSKSLKFVNLMRKNKYILETASENLNSVVYCLPYIMNNDDFYKFIETAESIINDEL